MSRIIVDPKREDQTAEGNGMIAGASNGRPRPESQNSLVDHPLWPDFLAELQASRQADKAAAEREWAEAASAE